MLTQIKLHKFKCFDSLTLPLSSLTLMTGFNAAGKSTTLQSILLLSQSLRSGNHSAELPLNGQLVNLGTPGEIMNSGDGEIRFSFEDDDVEVQWSFEAEDRSKGVAMHISHISITNKDGKKEFKNVDRLELLLPDGVDQSAKSIVNKLRESIFLSAVRQGTAEVFPSPESASPIHADVGVQGEFAPWWFQQFIDEEIEDARCNPSDKAKTLRRQFNAWANELFPGAQCNALSIEKTSLMRLELRIGDTEDWRRPSNIGYGLTYAFPVIVAGLLAKPGQILIIDSPEAHLHPLGQSQMGCFLAKMAAAGVQVIIETHSDHVLNGIRLAVKNQLVSKDNVSIHFFNQTCPTGKRIPRVISPMIDKEGNLSEWPEGFFDQSEKDLARLAGWQ